MAAAAEYVVQEKEHKKETRLRVQLWRRIAQSFPDALRNGEATRCLGNTLNVSFPGFDSETMLMALDLEGVCASSGSACMVGSVVASHVLLGMGRSVEWGRLCVGF